MPSNPGRAHVALAAALASSSCTPEGRHERGASGPGGDGGDNGIPASGAESAEGDGDAEGGADAGGDDLRFDLGDGSDVDPGLDPDGEVGCEKVDFLFVVDNSGSMADEQANLVTSFPGFIETIESTLMAEDFHIMAVDTDASGNNSTTVFHCSPAPQCCDQYCATDPTATCNDLPCVDPGDACDSALGAGQDDDANGNDCNIQDGARYITEGQPNLAGTFACAARVGIEGSGDEKPMAATLEAVTSLTGPGGCNDGFLRDDAILVVTLITDEEDDPNDGDALGPQDPNSPGDPASWKQALVQAKNGDPNAVVVLGLVGDTDLPDGLCEPIAGFVGAEPAPRLRQFADSFPFGQWGSVCAPDYAPFFAEAVSVIDSACDDFVPPG